MNAETTRFEINFDSGFFQLTRAGLNSFGLKGRGEIEFGHAVAIRAGSKELAFLPSEIVNAQRNGRAVRFEVKSDPAQAKPQPRWITLFASDEQAAQALLERLPAQVTEEFVREQAATREFAERLVQATPRAYATPAIVAINILVFLLMAADGAGVVQPDGLVHVRWGSNFGPLTAGGEWWRLFTCMFLHFGVIHLAFNMWALYDTGRLVERLYGNAHFVVLYVAAGLCGSMASLLWNPMVNSAGASGAIFGVYGALLAYVVRPGSEVPVSVMTEHRNSTVVFILYSLFYGFSHSGIDNAAHLGGLAGGAAVGWLLARPLEPSRRASAGRGRLAAVLVAVPLVLVLATFPLRNAAPELAKQIRYERDLNWFVDEEKRLVAELEKWRRDGQSGKLDTKLLANRLELEIARPWQTAYDRMSANMLDEKSPHRPRQDLLLQYIAGRRDGFKLIAEGMRAGTSGKREEGMKRLQDANRALDQLNALNAKKK